MFLVEGIKNVDALLRSDYTIERIFATEPWLERNRKYEQNTAITKLNDATLERISAQINPEQVLAISKTKSEHFDINAIADKVILLLDGINDPGNLGTIIRTADWFGVKKIVCSKHTVDCYNPKVVHSAMGSLFTSNIYYENLEAAITKLKQNRKHKVYATALNGTDVKQISFEGKSAIVIGSESHGINTAILKICDKLISVKSAGMSQAESLNAGVATGIVLHCIR
ncbi:MAG: RNA methyltransferase [Bacteroidetes bacterium]|nr:RNA methyltransferase [Bacteroidota bacterium]